MTTGIVHHTPADATFSGDGKTDWEAAHDIKETGGATLDVGAIPDGQFLKRSGTSIIGTTVAASTDVIFAAAPNTDFDLTNGGAGGAVTIISKTVAGIVAGDQIIFEVQYTILNNSTATRIYTQTWDLGALSINSAETSGILADATKRSMRSARTVFTVSASNLAYAVFAQTGAQQSGVSSTYLAVNAGAAWGTTISDLTGSQTVDFKMTSPATTATQTLTLHGYTIRKISTI